MLSRGVPKLLPRVLERARGDAHDLVHALVEERSEDLVLALEVPVDGGPGNARGLADLIDAHGCEPSLTEEVRGDVEDLRVACHRTSVAQGAGEPRIVRQFGKNRRRLGASGAGDHLSARTSSSAASASAG